MQIANGWAETIDFEGLFGTQESTWESQEDFSCHKIKASIILDSR